MHRARGGRWRSVVGGILGLAVVVLTGCSPESGEGERASQSMSQVSLRLTTPEQAFGVSARHVEGAGFLRQVSIARVRVEVSGEDIPTPIVAECTLPQPTQPECQVVDQTDTSTTLEIALTVPLGPNRLVRVTAFDASGTIVLLGRSTVNLTEPSQQVTVLLDPAVQLSDLDNRTFTFNDGAAFGLSGQAITLEFSTFTDGTAPVTLRVPATGGAATGTATIASLDIIFNEITNIAGLGSSFSFDATLQDGQLTLVNTQTGVSSSAALNAPPVAQDDLRSTLENTTITINVLTNDSDPDGDALSITAITPPLHGAAVDNGDGTIDYMPNLDFNGVDTFTYTIRDPGGLTATATVTVEVFFDHFDLGFLDAMKWEELEFVRKIQDGKLLMRIRSFDPSDMGNRLVANLTSFNAVKANVTVTEVDNANAFPAAILVGSFYNIFGTNTIDDATGDVLGAIGIGHNGTDLVVVFAVLLCDDALCELQRFVHIDRTTFGTVALGTTHEPSIEWDGAVFTFGFDGNQRVFDPTTVVDQNGALLAPIVSPTPGRPFLALRTQVFGLPNEIIPNLLPDPVQGGSITATFDDVMVNGSPFDDFASSHLDPTKWRTLEFVRKVQNGKLVSSVRQSGPLLPGEDEENELKFRIPIGPTSFQAEVMITEVTNAGTFPFAFLSGAFYKDSTNAFGDEGDVFAFVGIGHNGTDLIVFFGVARCDDENCDTITLLHFDTTTFGTVALNTLHTLLLTWDGTVFTFGFDGNTTSFDPTPQAPVVAFPRDFFRNLGTRIGGSLNSAATALAVRALGRTNGLLSPLNPGEEGSITAMFENVRVFQRMPPVTTVKGQVVDQNSNPVAGASVITNGERTGVTGADGSFSIPEVPAVLGDITVTAIFTDTQSVTFTGASDPALPRFGDTVVGTFDADGIFQPFVILTQQDVITLESEPFSIPAGMSSLKFEMNFLTNESVDMNIIFDDLAIALVRSDGTAIERILSGVNRDRFFPADPLSTGFRSQTGFRTVVFDVSSLAGNSVVLVIRVLDIGDSIVDSAVLIDNIRLEDTNTVQQIPNGGFENGNFDNFAVMFSPGQDVSAPPMLAAVLTRLGPILPPQGNFMAFLSTGSEASGNILVPPGVVVTPNAE